MRLHIRSSFVAKLLAAVALVALGDRLFWAGGDIGSNLGVFALAWTIATVSLVPAIRHRRLAMLAIACATGAGGVLLYDPGPLAFLIFWTLLSGAALLHRQAAFDHAGRWAVHLVTHGITSTIGPWVDLFQSRQHARAGTVRPASLVRLLALPLAGGAIFLLLFAAANPVIGNFLAELTGPSLDSHTVYHLLLWSILLIAVWATLRPRRIWLPFPEIDERAPPPLPGVSIASVTLALLVFNALFALQNGLDLAYLWSGAPLPEGVTLAGYAHQGAYPLIVTALLAGLFVLVALRPGSTTAAVPLIRLLVVLWIVQNVFLVASTILRTIDYIEVYSLTRLRVAAMIWMALVAVGLLLILWRMLAGRSAAWLINANALGAGLVLFACTVVDLGAVSAAWNVRHAREVGGKGARLDLCYLDRLGPSALVPLVELELRGGLDPDFASRLAWVRHEVLVRTSAGQEGGGWIWRNDLRLRRVVAMLGGRKLAAPPPAGPDGRDCDGTPIPPPVTPEIQVEATGTPTSPEPAVRVDDHGFGYTEGSVAPVNAGAPAVANGAADTAALTNGAAQ